MPGPVLRRRPRPAAQRLSTAFRIILLIPIAILLGTVNGEGLQFTFPSRSYGITAIPAGVGGALVIGPAADHLVPAQVPPWWSNWNQLQRFINRVGIYLSLMDDRYPPPATTSRCTCTTPAPVS